MSNRLGTEQEQLEALIGRIGLADVLRHISVICAGKAEHIEVYWGDEALAANWRACAVACAAATDAAVAAGV